MRARDAVAAHGDAVVRDVDLLGIDERAARAELREHPAPVRVVAVERALHELAVRRPRAAAMRASASVRAPTTRTRTNFVAPSASRAICSASEPHTSVSASVSACASTAPARPLASTSTVSLVERQPSTLRQSNVSRDRVRRAPAAARPGRRRRRW